MKESIDFGAVLIADPASSRDAITIEQEDLECAEPEYLEEVRSSLVSMCPRFTYYSSLKEFLGNIMKHESDVVFSIWSGARSRNRKALVPSICEAFGIAYVGADTYTNVLCQDKALAKNFAQKHGFKSAESVLIRYSGDLPVLRGLTLPLVVKPNFEGGSIGISQRNLVYSHEQAEALAGELLAVYSQPILVEEFIKGREVSLVLAGNRNDIAVEELLETVFDADSAFIESTIYSYELKKGPEAPHVFERPAPDLLSDELLQSARSLFRALDKVDILRIDGRFRGSDFHLIELSPDVHYGSRCSVAQAFRRRGFAYNDMIRYLLLNAKDDHRFRSAST